MARHGEPGNVHDSRATRRSWGTGGTGPDISIIPSLAETLGQQRSVIAVILFGSVARNEQKPFSDIDICIVTDRTITDEEKAELAGYSSPSVEISFFHDLPVAIRYRAIKEGKILYCRDSLALRRVMKDTIRIYLDFQPVLRRYALHALGIGS